LHAHVDSGHNQFGDGKAQGGFGIYLAGGPIDFLSQKHEIVTDSTLYSGYVALWKVGKRVEVVLNLIEELGDAVSFLNLGGDGGGRGRGGGSDDAADGGDPAVAGDGRAGAA
jgi:hypothetical protein